MKIAVLSTSDIQGGAARAAYATHTGLKKAGIDSTMLVNLKESDDYSVIGLQSSVYPERYPERLIRSTKVFLDTLPLKQYKNKKIGLFSVAKYGESILPYLEKIHPDVVNVHWCCNGFLNPKLLPAFKRPVVYTLHDMWGFTGGCHYAGDCLKYQQKCGACPSLSSDRDNDLSREIWSRKNEAWNKLNLTIVCVSRWLSSCAKQSSLFRDKRVEVIHPAIDVNRFKPRSKQLARELLDLPADKKIILFGATRALDDSRKGFCYVVDTMKRMESSALADRIELVIFGAGQPQSTSKFRFKAHYLGKIQDDLVLALAYAAADVMLVPSTEEAFGLTACEAIACGTPVVCFDSTGLKDIVDHQENGYRAARFESQDLANGLEWVLEDSERGSKLSDQARKKAEKAFSYATQSQAYVQLFKEVASDRTISTD